MLKNKITINKYFLGLLLVICLMFISCGFGIENSYAVELNETNDDKMEINLNVVDKLENSQDNTLLGARQITLNGGKFSDIQNLIHYNLTDGDTIILNGEFKSDGANSHIIVYKNIAFKSPTKATLDAKNLSSIFVVERGGSGSSFSICYS